MKLLIRSNFAGREQYVSFCEYESKREKIDVGVLQGSILGLEPILFFIVINELQNKLFSFK